MNLVGMRFQPTDEEIISHYLVNKINGNNDPTIDQVISEVDVYQQEPWHLPYYSRTKSNDQVWYFFCSLQYCSNSRINRKISDGSGYWKATGKVRMIRASDNGVEIGKKRTLVFYSKDPKSDKGVKTDWVTHEYSAVTDVPSSQLVLWKLKNKGDDWTDNREEGELGEHVDSDNNDAEHEKEADRAALEFADSCLKDEESVLFDGSSSNKPIQLSTRRNIA